MPICPVCTIYFKPEDGHWFCVPLDIQRGSKVEGEWIGPVNNAPALCAKCGAYWKCDCFDAVKFAIDTYHGMPTRIVDPIEL